MFLLRTSVAFVLFAALVASPALAARTHRNSTSSQAHKRHHGSKTQSRTSHKLHGQTAIEPARVTQIQQALIREHYLAGEANGTWDPATEAAMRKYQADQGWQTKLMPDSRALKKLGLGPDYSDAINAKGSSFSQPHPTDPIPSDQSSNFAAAAGINQ